MQSKHSGSAVLRNIKEGEKMAEKYKTCQHSTGNVGELIVYVRPGCPRLSIINGVMCSSKVRCKKCISYKAVDDLEKIRPYEPNVVKAAWNIFGKSYEYRKKYNEYKEKRREMEKVKVDEIKGQMSFLDFPEVIPEEMRK